MGWLFLVALFFAPATYGVSIIIWFVLFINEHTHSTPSAAPKNISAGPRRRQAIGLGFSTPTHNAANESASASPKGRLAESGPIQPAAQLLALTPQLFIEQPTSVLARLPEPEPQASLVHQASRLEIESPLRQAIRMHATALEIPRLVHFTQATNLPAILTHGIYPRARIHEINVIPATNDSLRLDRHEDGTSISIAFPNSSMFYKYRMSNPQLDWAVLILEPSLLWEKECAFCCHNAASSRVSRRPLSELKTDQAFRAMFDELPGFRPRSELGLESFDPTDVQAEVLVFGVIEPRYITGVHFDNQSMLSKYALYLQNRTTRIEPHNQGVFASRDFERMRVRG